MATKVPMNTLKKVIYKGEELNSFSAGGCEWRKPYSLTIPTKPTGVANITVGRTATDSNCDQVTASSFSSSGTVLYGDTLNVTASPSNHYNNPTVSFSSGVTNGKVTGDVVVGITAGTGKTYSVTYSNSDSTITGTLPTKQSAVYPNTITLSTNSMTKSNLVQNSYVVSYARGNADSSASVPSAQTSTSTTTYNANAWTTAAGTTVATHSNGQAITPTSNLTLYPCFSKSSPVNNGVTTSNINMVRGNQTESGNTVTYKTGLASTMVALESQTADKVRSYTHAGWSTSANGDKTYNKNSPTGALNSHITLYPYYTSTITAYGNVTLKTNSATKDPTTATSYTVTYSNGLATGGTLPSTQISQNKTTYTANGWTTSSSDYTKDYDNGQTITSLSENLTLYPCFDRVITNQGITLQTNSMTKTATEADSYVVRYYNGTATSGTLPSNQTSKNKITYTANGWTTGSSDYTRDYINGQVLSSLTDNLTLYPCFIKAPSNQGVTLGTNSMTRSNKSENSYTVTYAQGNASNTTNLPSAQTSINTTKYTADGWTTTSGSIYKRYDNNVSTGPLSADLNLYPCFTQTITNSGVTLSSNKMTKSNTSSPSYTVSYVQGDASNSTNLPSTQTAYDQLSWTHDGWAKTASGNKAYNLGASTGALNSGNMTLYPHFTSSVASVGTVTLSSNNMVRYSTTAPGYTVSYDKGIASSGILPSTSTATDTIAWTHDGWDDDERTSGATAHYTKGQVITPEGDLHLLPHFSSSISTYGSVTLGTNNMAKDTTYSYYTITYNQGNASSTTNLPSAQSVLSGGSAYNPDGWSAFPSATKKSYSNGATVTVSQNMTLYPYFASSPIAAAISATLSSNQMSRNNSTTDYHVTYAKGSANSDSLDILAVLTTSTTNYTHDGWATSKNGSKAYDLGDEVRPSNLSLYPHFSSSISHGKVTLPNATYSRNSTTENSYTVSYNKGTATGVTGTAPATQTSKNQISYTHTAWTEDPDENESGTATVYQPGTQCEISKNTTFYPTWSSSKVNQGVTTAASAFSKPSVTTATYTVTYNANSGTGTAPSSQTVTKKTMYTQMGWSKSSSGTILDYLLKTATGALTDSIILYPYFTSKPILSMTILPDYCFTKIVTASSGAQTINFEPDNGTAAFTMTADKITSYAQNGWSTGPLIVNDTDLKAAGDSVNITANTTFYAQYSTSGTTSYNSITLPTRTKSGYTLLGWQLQRKPIMQLPGITVTWNNIGDILPPGSIYTPEYSDIAQVAFYDERFLAIWSVEVEITTTISSSNATFRKETTSGDLTILSVSNLVLTLQAPLESLPTSLKIRPFVNVRSEGSTDIGETPESSHVWQTLTPNCSLASGITIDLASIMYPVDTNSQDSAMDSIDIALDYEIVVDGKTYEGSLIIAEYIRLASN